MMSVLACIALAFSIFCFCTSGDSLKEERYISFINEKWHLSLPEENYVLIYSKYPNQAGIQGDGDRFHIIVYDNDISKAFEMEPYNVMWEYFKTHFYEKIIALGVDEKYLPKRNELESGEIYYLNTSDHDELYMIYMDEVYIDNKKYSNVLLMLESYI